MDGWNEKTREQHRFTDREKKRKATREIKKETAGEGWRARPTTRDKQHVCLPISSLSPPSWRHILLNPHTHTQVRNRPVTAWSSLFNQYIAFQEHNDMQNTV